MIKNEVVIICQSFIFILKFELYLYSQIFNLVIQYIIVIVNKRINNKKNYVDSLVLISVQNIVHQF
jgi:hypothetical protein